MLLLPNPEEHHKFPTDSAHMSLIKPMFMTLMKPTMMPCMKMTINYKMLWTTQSLFCHKLMAIPCILIKPCEHLTEKNLLACIKEVNDQINCKHWELVPRSQIPKDIEILPAIWSMKQKHDINILTRLTLYWHFLRPKSNMTCTWSYQEALKANMAMGRLMSSSYSRTSMVRNKQAKFGINTFMNGSSRLDSNNHLPMNASTIMALPSLLYMLTMASSLPRMTKRSIKQSKIYNLLDAKSMIKVTSVRKCLPLRKCHWISHWGSHCFKKVIKLDVKLWWYCSSLDA